MAHPEHQMYERLLDLGQGLAIYKAHIDLTREQDKNARVMAAEKFERLTANIERDKRLESLPYAVLVKDSERVEFHIISGHHRIRAARKAGVTEIHLIVDETELTRSQIISKQLAHNALNGIDDPQILKELYGEIDDLAAKIATGLTEEEVSFETAPIIVDEVNVEFNYEVVNLLFLRSDFRKFEDAIELLEPEARVYLADKADFDNFRTIMRSVSSRFKIYNSSAIIAKWIEILLDYCAMRDANDPSGEVLDQWVPLSGVIGTEAVPAAAAVVIQQAVDKMKSAGDISEKNLWQALEFLAANYVSE